MPPKTGNTDIPNETTSLLSENPYDFPSASGAAGNRTPSQGTNGAGSANAGASSSGVLGTVPSSGAGGKPTVAAKTGTTVISKVLNTELGPNITPQRASRTIQKMKLLPDSLDYGGDDDDDDNDDDDDEDDDDEDEDERSNIAKDAKAGKNTIADSIDSNIPPSKSLITAASKAAATNSSNQIPHSGAITSGSNEFSQTKGKPTSYSLRHIKDRSARKDAQRLGKKHRKLLPRVTTYCTAGSYKMRELIRWLKDKKRIYSTSPKLFDECIYTPFEFKDWRSGGNNHNGNKNNDNDHLDKKNSQSRRKIPGVKSLNDDLIRLDDEGGEIDVGKRSQDIFIFEYGVVVLWGFSLKEEKSFLIELAKFENEKLSDEDVQAEEFNYYITQSYQPRIYNDFITLRDDSNYMLKLSISYAISQSVKISLFEELVDNTIEDTQDIPQQIAQKGKVEMTREEIMKSIGELFILRININLHGSVLDSPELMWSEPTLEPIYQATRGYLEINQRVTLLNQRLEVISDLLQMLKEQLGHSNDEYLELIVIILIAAEVVISIINIIVDLIAIK
ncbi:hypothetical protein BVG19_g3261 [[Candida] boidinii]|nr:hypothetical protein BVG19_g3261 [[Candida] boidinii]OWB49497.1 hypothetical protein B5S27_g1038 [[Candida] boidinii]